MDRDPWNWSVEDVQRFFRNDAAMYISEMPHGRLPPLDPFLSSLNNNDVSGAVLLTAIDAATLRDDCGIASLGQRGAVLHCITKLRKQSIIHAAQNASFGLQTPPLLPAKAPTSALAVPNAVPSPNEDAQPVGEHIRAGEQQVEDSRGRKRRKLDLTRSEVPVKADGALKDLTTATARSEYFRDNAFTVDEIFYGNTEWGSEVAHLEPPGDVIVVKPDKEKGLGEDSFQFLAQNTSAGESDYIHSRIRHFLTKDAEDIDLLRGGREAVALLPYPERLFLKSRSATVLQFDKNDGHDIAVRENAVYLHDGKGVVEPTRQSPGEWDFLMEKHIPDEEDVANLSAKSASGDAEPDPSSSDSDAESLAEVDDEAENEQLSSVRIVEVIDRSLEQMIDNWTTQKLPKLEEKQAWTIWRQTKQSYSYREALIKGAERWISHFTKRLDKMKDDMISYTWQTENQLRGACDSMEPTVKDREKQKWMIDVWNRRQEPPHTARHRKPAKKARPSSSTVRVEQPIPIHPYDRYSISPAPMAGEDLNHDADDEMQVDTPNEGAGHISDEIQYELNDEDNDVTPSSPALSQDLRDFIVPSSEEALDVPAVDFGELAEDDLQDLQIREQVNNAKDANYLPTGDEDENDSESELPSPSTFIAPRKDKTPKKPANPAVDLTAPSESEPPRRPGRPPKGATKVIQPVGDPNSATADDVDAWDFDFLVRKDDRLRILIRLLRDAGPEFRNTVHEYLRSPHIGRVRFAEYLRAAVESCRTSTTSPDLPSDKAETMSHVAEIFIRWAIPKLAQQKSGTLDAKSWNIILDPKQFPLFTNVLWSTLLKKDSKLFVTPKTSPVKGSSSAPIDISSGSETRLAQQEPFTPRRRKKLERSTAAKSTRAMAHSRQQRYNESQTTDSAQLAAMIQSDPSYSQIEINPVKNEDQDFIYVPDEIAQKMKAHQIDGVRFLWREVNAEGDDAAQGCVLAHTMGLGKTMQTIAFLCAVNEASASEMPSVYEQLPTRLRLRANGTRRQLRILIICPPGLIQNWLREIDMWANKQQLGNIFALDTSNKKDQTNMLENWMNTGGVLMVGYQRFRSMLTEKVGKKDSRSPQDIAAYRRALLKGPEIVIADEAQSLKDDKTDISKIVNQIGTHSRIALTGTPMSNEVDEIYVIISWVAPGFLGDSREFRAYFSEPIKKGLYLDSTAYEKRKGTMQLKVLHSDIAPKVNRATIEALKGSLKPKIEFIITMPLKPVQDKLYRRYVQMLRSGDKTDKAATVALFGWLSDLSLVTAHPDCLRRKLVNPKDNTKSRERTPSSATDSGSVTPLRAGGSAAEEDAADGDSGDEGGEEEQEPPLDSNELQTILQEFPNDQDPALSTKVSIFLKLLNFSLECRDKVLVFSNSLPTLNYLQDLLRQLNKKAGRIDGSAKMSERTNILEKFHNEGIFDVDGMNIMLVSTKAGGVGLNIQDANRVFIFDFKFNPTTEEQAIGRSYRLGQKKPVYVYHFVAGGTFEENIYNTRLLKASLQKRVIDKKNVKRVAKRELLDYLYEPQPVAQKDILSWSGSDPHVLDRLLEQHGPEDEGKIDTMIRAIETMATLQEETREELLDEEALKEVNEQIQQGRNRPRNQRPVAPSMRPPAAAPSASMMPPSTSASAMRPAPRPSSTMPTPGAYQFGVQYGRPSPMQAPSNTISHSHPISLPQPQQYPQPPHHPLGGLPMTDNDDSNQ